MSSPTLPLFTRSLKGWFGAKGFWLVVGAALLPLLLTGAWVATHRADVAITGVTWNASDLREGQIIHVVATVKNLGSVAADGFNNSVVLGTLSPTGDQVFAINSSDTRIDHLGPGESKQLTLDAKLSPGILYILAQADTADTVGEIDEFNNLNATPLAVGYALPGNESAPKPPANLTGTANASVHVDLAVASLSLGETPVRGGKNHTFTATFTNHGPDAIHNATAHLQFSSGFPGRSENLDLAAGGSKDVTLDYLPQEGAYWLQAYITTPADAQDSDAANNHQALAFTVDPVLTATTPSYHAPEKQTIKDFYAGVLTFYLRLILPLIALFYAAGIISDERDRRALGYILTKPTPRWLFPITKFVASFLVAAAASLIGVALTFALLFGTTPQGKEVGYFTTPLFASLVTLFAYGSLFTLAGVYVERPFLAGMAFIAWEAVNVPYVLLTAIVNQLVLAPWMKNVSIAFHVQNALHAWPVDKGLQWLPTGDDGQGMRALAVLLIGGVALLVGAAYVMRRKEFEL